MPPDLIVLSITLHARSLVYESAMEQAEAQLEALRAALEGAGFPREALKTADLRVNTEFHGEQDEKGVFRQVFDGYCCTHGMRLEFDLDPHRLSQALSAMAGSTSEPEFSVRFSVRDKEAVSAALLQSAVRSAAEKARILCDSAGVRLGELCSVSYHWGDLPLDSGTRYEMADGALPLMSKAAGLSIEPEEIRVSDEVTLVWAIG